MKNLHKEFVRLGRERNRITYKLLALLPKINELKIYEKEGYANIYNYSAKIAGLSSRVVGKTLKLKEKLRDMPHLQKAIETQGINKVGIVAGLATRENEKELAEKVEHMSKPALQEYSKEVRGKGTVSWPVEVDEKMMFMFLKLKKKLGKNLSNKECLRKILEHAQSEAKCVKSKFHETDKKPKSQKQAQNPAKIPGEKGVQAGEKSEPTPKQPQKVTRYISVNQRRELSNHCSHPGCHRPAEIIHHPDRFSQNHSHENLRSLCKRHHEFAHNGISEPMHPADHKYRKHRQVALINTVNFA